MPTTLNSIQQTLLHKLQHHLPDDIEGDFEVYTHYLHKCDFNLLSWLKVQPIFPQYYLNWRDSEAQTVAIGQVLTFNDLTQAQQFILHTPLTLVGGITFEDRAYFFLPRFLLEKNLQTLKLSVIVHTKLSSDLAHAIEQLTLWNTPQPLCPVAHIEVFPLAQKMDFSAWQQCIEQILAGIKQQHFTKVVLANETTFGLHQPLNSVDFLATSELFNQGCFHYLLATHPDCIFLGSTPERLYARQGQQIITEALAGTASRTEDPKLNEQQAQWLLQDEKNIHENQLVVEEISQNLAPYCSTHIHVGTLAIKPLRKVQHLYREMKTTLVHNIHDQTCLKAIHPTAAVAGLPRESARDFLYNHEPLTRNWYAGTLGKMNREQAEFCVTIRCAEITPKSIHVFAGAGIVEGSDPLAEWQEIERKASGLISLLTVNQKRNANE